MVRSWRIMEALIYGLSPSAMTEKFARVPPENKSRRPRNWFPANAAFKLTRFTPATGMWAKRRKIRKIAAVKRIFFLTSGVLIALWKTPSICFMN